MRARLRSVWDRLLFLARAEWVYLLGLVGLVVALAPLLPAWPQWASILVAIAAAVMSLAMFAKDTRALSKRFSQRVLTPLNPLTVPKDASLVPHEYRGLGTMLVSPDLDRLLKERGREITVSAIVEDFQLPADLRELAPYVLSRTTGARWPYNEMNLRLATDLDVASFGRDLRVQPVSYFDFLCSNELMKFQIHHAGQDECPADRHLVDSRGRLRLLSESQLANTIGVSTIAITTDNFVLLVRQTSANAASGGLQAPSGSGSLDLTDIEGVSDLPGLVEAGVVREMREETGIPMSMIGATRLSGYGRWLDRGAKPEFFAYTRLLATREQVDAACRKARLAPRERIFTAGFDWVRLVDAVAQFPRDGAVPTRPSRFVQTASLPLLVALEKYVQAVDPAAAGPDD